MEQSKERRANVKVGFYGRGKTRVGQDGVKTKDIVVGGEIQSKAVCEGGGDDQGCDGEFSRGGGGGGESGVGVPKGGGVLDGHGWGIEREIAREFLMRETRGAK